MDSEAKAVSGPWSLAAYYVRVHGGLTFGVVSAILMWHIMVRPELDRKSIDAAEQRSLIEALRENVAHQRSITEHIRTTAEILDRLAARKSNND